MLDGIEIDLTQKPAGVLLFRFSEMKQIPSQNRELTLASFWHELHTAFTTMPERYRNAIACQTSSDLTDLLADLDANYHARSIYSGMRDDIAQKLKSRPHAFMYSNSDKSLGAWEAEDMAPQFKIKIALELGLRMDGEEALIEDRDNKRNSPRI